MSKRWGATPEDWLHFDIVLGLSEDLLPVVSNIEAEISPDSKMKALGKTPSDYNTRRQARGMAGWTDMRPSSRLLERWMKEPDYGICLQTRAVRGLDVDVPDVQLSARIARRFCEILGADLPQRSRPGTGKVLLAFTLPGNLSKRSFKVDGGLVEFLATGQQFICVGTHPSGSRYEWAAGLPDEIPTVSVEAFEKAWTTLVAEFAIEGERRASRRDGGGLSARPTAGVDDVATYLEAEWETYGYDREGEKLFVSCPWRDGHSGDSGETEAAWLLAGTQGYQRGHYQCLHASCQGRKDEDFLDAVGYRVAQFEDVSEVYLALARAGEQGVRQGEASAGEATPRLPLPGFKRNKVTGEIDAVIENVVRAVEHPEACGLQVRFDTFRGELMVSPLGVEGWRPFKDADAVQMRINLSALSFKPVSKEMMRDAIVLVAETKQFDSAQFWLEGLPAWDGVPRVRGFYPRYFSTADNAYTQAVGAYMWTAHAGRIMDPGCKADMVPVVVGAQGSRKSSGVAAISPSLDFFNELDLKADDDKLARLMRGLLVAELGELKGLNSRDAESIKAWIVKRYDAWIPKFMEHKIVYPRRSVLHGTHNVAEFMADDTGERRWLPMMSGVVDVDGIVADRDQLWAEALALWREHRIMYQEAERLARAEHHAFKVSDSWAVPIAAWLATENIAGVTPQVAGGITTHGVLHGALGFDDRQITTREEKRVAKAMRQLGYELMQFRFNGVKGRYWVLEDEI